MTQEEEEKAEQKETPHAGSAEPDSPAGEPEEEREDADDVVETPLAQDEAEEYANRIDARDEVDDEPLREEEREAIWLRAKTLKLGLLGQEILEYYVTEHPNILRRFGARTDFWERLLDLEAKGQERLRAIVDHLWEIDPPQPGENPQAVKENHRMRAREILMAEIFSSD